MSDTRLGLKPRATDQMSPVDFGVRAEELGYESVWVSEGWSEDAFVTLGQIACRTEEISLGSAVVSVYSRTPATLAQAAVTLDEAAGGRLRLGLGASHPQLAEDLHGIPYDNPVKYTAETIELTRAFIESDADTVDYAGEFFEVSGFPPYRERVPIYNAAMGPLNRRVTGELCDGWLPQHLPFSNLEAAFETVKEAARDVGRDPANVTVSPIVPVAVSDNPAEARDAIREYVATYVSKYDAYTKAVSQRYADEVGTIRERWKNDGAEAAIEAVPNDIVHDIGIAGSPSEAREQLDALLNRSVVDVPLLTPPKSVNHEQYVLAMETLAPANL